MNVKPIQTEGDTMTRPKSTTKHFKSLLALAIGSSLLLASTAFAHRPFIKPSSTIVNGKAPWVSFDAAAASDVFYFDHVALNLSNLSITAADGSIIKPESVNVGKFRSSFDLATPLRGTYKIGTYNEGVNASYKDNGTPKRWRGSVEAFAKEVPANAEGLEVTMSQARIETFVTNGKPSDTALTRNGKGLEFAPITHPNDLVDGESAQFRFLVDGQPVAGVKITVIADGIRYRQKLNEQSYTTDQDGRVRVTWQGAGLYWLEATYQDKKVTLPAAKERRLSYIATLEVLPQ